MVGENQLPRHLPVFPLPGALLLPGGRLPLNIFEPRYLNLVTEALGHGRVMGMIQPREETGHPVPDGVAIYDVGCAGRIISFNETEDGRFLVTLGGISRFRVTEEMPVRRGFRRVVADYAPYEDDLDPEDEGIHDKEGFFDLVGRYLKLKGIDADMSAVRDAEDRALVTSLAMTCPFGVGEKQALLEASGTAGRGEILATLMEIAVGEAGNPESAVRH